jgi:nucleotide-binding universal stress UspA family protein
LLIFSTGPLPVIPLVDTRVSFDGWPQRRKPSPSARAANSVRRATRREDTVEINRIVLGLDGSPAAGCAARWSAEAVASSDGEVIAVHGLGILPEVSHPQRLLSGAAGAALTGLGMPSGGTGDWKDELRRVLDDDWCQPLREAGVRYRCVLADTDPVHALLETARREEADLIVVGTAGESGFLHRLFGSTSYEVIHHARQPIVAVPFAPAEPLEARPPPLQPVQDRRA